MILEFDKPGRSLMLELEVAVQWENKKKIIKKNKLKSVKKKKRIGSIRVLLKVQLLNVNLRENTVGEKVIYLLICCFDFFTIFFYWYLFFTRLKIFVYLFIAVLLSSQRASGTK